MWPTNHLTADDLDAFHSEALSSEMRLHLETCEQCRQLVAADRQLLQLLSQVSSLRPSKEFEERVMAKVVVARPVRVPLLSFPKLGGSRLAATIALAAALVASVGWSAANRATLDGWLADAGKGLLTAGWAWLSASTASLVQQPWFGVVAQAWDTPIRLGASIAAFLTIYFLGLLALRRLITPSVEVVSNANA